MHRVAISISMVLRTVTPNALSIRKFRAACMAILRSPISTRSSDPSNRCAWLKSRSLVKPCSTSVRMRSPMSSGSLPSSESRRSASGAALPMKVRDADWSWEADRRLGDVACQRLRNIAKQCGYEDCNLEAVWGSVPSTIAKLTESFDLIVMAACKPCFIDHFRTSATLKTAKLARCSAMVVRSQ